MFELEPSTVSSSHFRQSRKLAAQKLQAVRLQPLACPSTLRRHFFQLAVRQRCPFQPSGAFMTSVMSGRHPTRTGADGAAHRPSSESAHAGPLRICRQSSTARAGNWNA